MITKTIDTDSESAYGSETTSLSTVTLKKERFSIIEPEPNHKQIRQKSRCFSWCSFFVITILVIIVAILMYALYSVHLENTNQAKLILSLKANITNDQNSSNWSSLQSSEGRAVLQKVSTTVATTMNSQTAAPTREAIQEPSHGEKSTNHNSFVHTSESYMIFNAASYTSGARVDTELSSKTNASSKMFARDQSNYVLFERDDLPLGRAWCSMHRTPRLTIHLFKNTTPIAVSYRHTKHYDEMPSGAPKLYDVYGRVLGMQDDWDTLATNCEYSIPADGEKGTEQICRIQTKLYDTVYDTIGFHIRENHGHLKTTCAYSVNVYGERRVPKTTKTPVHDAKLCMKTAYDYYNEPFWYSMREKDCRTLYWNKCCDACPECCRDCEMSDFNFTSIVSACIAIFILIICPCCISCVYAFVNK